MFIPAFILKEDSMSVPKGSLNSETCPYLKIGTKKEFDTLKILSSDKVNRFGNSEE